MTARRLFNLSAVAEVLVGIAFLVAPATVIDLLLGGGIDGSGETVSRVLGVALISLGIAVFEAAGPRASRVARIGICTYNVGVSVLLALVGSLGRMNGVLLWPAVGLHAVIGAMMLGVLLIRPGGAGDS